MILCAAIKYKNWEGEYIVPCRRHAEGYELLLQLTGVSKFDLYPACEDGFITTKGDWLDRREAYSHAVECGQLSETVEDISQGVLISEDLY
jgi:hypothetical protein